MTCQIKPTCTSWFDGCNTCGVGKDGMTSFCTMMYCFRMQEAHCQAVATLNEGDACTTTRLRGSRNMLKCADGLVCDITDRGQPEVDIPNSGRCKSIKQVTKQEEQVVWGMSDEE